MTCSVNSVFWELLELELEEKLELLELEEDEEDD